MALNLGAITNSSIVDCAKITHDGGTAATGVGVGLVFQIDDAGGIEEQASIDALLTDVTNGSEDADIQFRQNVGGTMATRVIMDADGANLIASSTTPWIAIGDGGAEDTKLVYDGVYDFYIGIDDSDDQFVIGTNSSVGASEVIAISSNGTVTLTVSPVG